MAVSKVFGGCGGSKGDDKNLQFFFLTRDIYLMYIYTTYLVRGVVRVVDRGRKDC